MYIEEVIVDGFKSYATRTVLSGFDKHFNAITGLNGSGKSNILDSICFVLGITNLTQVRVGNLQELVYKQGQAGVTKASVTLVFNNKDKAGSPVGYEQYDQITITRQVVIGGKNKYIVNGHTAQAGQVQNLFHSVQLNVNNPHFLIMQGRITKVLNMKPAEILGMIEEAAGTRMFENKKQSALKTISKKQSKVDEINSILKNDIEPTLEKLRAEKTHYLKWSANNAEMERLQRFCTAYDFLRAEATALEGEAEEVALAKEKEELEQNVKALQASVKALDKEMDKLAEEKEKHIAGDFKTAQSEEARYSRALVQANTEWQNAKALQEGEEKALRDVQTGEADMEQGMANKAEQIAKCKEAAGPAEADLADKTARHQALSTEYSNAMAGLSTGGEGGDEALTLTDQMDKAQAEASSADSRVKQGKMKVAHLKGLAKQVEKEMNAAEKDARKLTADHAKAASTVQEVTKRMSAVKYDEERVEVLGKEREALQTSIAEREDLVERLHAQLAGRLAFDYSAPAGFDRSKVRGLVAKLLEVKDAAHSTALEVTAGGRLFQVVVDDDKTGKTLLQKGKLRRRVTIIPLNRINGSTMEQKRVDRAKSLADRSGGTAQLAMELVGFDPSVRAAMGHVFGTTIVCDSMDTAKQITYDKGVKARTVTLDGATYEPSGTLTGGSKGSIGVVLGKLQQLGQANRELGSMQERLSVVSKELKALTADADTWNKLSGELELKTAQLEMLATRLAESDHSQQAAKLRDTTEALKKEQEEMEVAAKTMKSATARHAKLKAEEDAFRSERESMLQRLEASVKEAKGDVAKATAGVKKQRQKLQVLELELEQLQSDKGSMAKQLEAATKGVEGAVLEVERLGEDVREVKAKYMECKERVDQLKKELAARDGEAKKLRKQKEEQTKLQEKEELSHKKLTHKLERHSKERKAAKTYVAHLLKQHAWIKQERGFFGKEGTDYDFEARDAKVAQARLKAIHGEQASISKKINKKVMGMIEKAESECKELRHKRLVIEEDKGKIEAVIEQLATKKNAALQSTWLKVTKDFGSIFGTLLPGTTAKLEPPEGCSVHDGLEVKVAFGNVWKESLTELSGGQRSLLALSLILSLLLFKPAPMYILDEVDAALDLSHTQNIGRMLKTHFSNSQFIVVSLKEGMFNNANVIFRTKFVDGISRVGRTANRDSSTSSSSSTTMARHSSDGGGPKGRKRSKHSKSSADQEGDENNVRGSSSNTNTASA